MKRILVLFILIGLVIGGIYAWMVLRPRPENLLRISLNHVIDITVVPIQASLQWEDADETERNYRFGGWVSFAGMLDARDLSAIRANGIIGYSSSPSQSDIETANMVLTKDRFAFQEKKFKQDRLDWIHSFSSSAESTQWYSVDRQILLNEMGYPAANTRATESELRKALKQIDLRSVLVIASSSEQIYAGREYMSIHLRVKEDAFMNALLTLGSVWKQDKLSEKDIVWIKEIAKDAAHGDWYIIIDEAAGDIVNLTGQWYSVDTQEHILGRKVLSMIFGVGAADSVNAKMSKDVKDLTEQLFPKTTGALPPSSQRVLQATTTNPGNVDATSTKK